MKRLESAMNDLLSLNKKVYCDLGPGKGYVSLKLKENNKEVIAVEAPWVGGNNWAQKNGIKMYHLEFFSGDFESINENVDCFILIHSIAHFKYSPYLLFEKIFNKLPKGGLFYLSTVNATDFHRVLDFMKGKPIVQKVSKDRDPDSNDLTQGFKTEMPQIWDDWMHVKEYTKPEIEEIFTNSGFQIEKSFYRNNSKHWKKDFFIRFFPHLSEEIVVIGRKP